MQLVGIQIHNLDIARIKNQRNEKSISINTQLCINTNTIIINIIVVLTGSKLCFTINRLSYHTTG